VLHVVDDELCPGDPGDLRHSRREELEDHRAEHRFAVGEALLDRIFLHGCFPGRFESGVRRFYPPPALARR
jgi:hypothetical protein